MHVEILEKQHKSIQSCWAATKTKRGIEKSIIHVEFQSITKYALYKQKYLMTTKKKSI